MRNSNLDNHPGKAPTRVRAGVDVTELPTMRRPSQPGHRATAPTPVGVRPLHPLAGRGPAAPPKLWAMMDEAVLHRLIGSRKIMHDQLLQLADMSCRPSVTLQVVPAGIGAHAGLLGGFAIASAGSPTDTVYMESPETKGRQPSCRPWSKSFH
jgi:hypothetical protein